MSEDHKDTEKKPASSVTKPKTDRFSKRANRLKDNDCLDNRLSMLWAMDYDMVSAPFERRTGDLNVQKLIGFLTESSTASHMLFDDQKQLRSEIVFDEQTLISQYYPEHNVIVLNPDRPLPELACMLIKEMRRAWQAEQGHLFNPLKFNPDDAILVNRAQQADALMIAIRVAWELKLMGEKDMWNFMIGAPFADVTRTYEIHAQNDFRSLNDGRAGRAAYDKWFEGQRTRIHDKRVIHQMLLEDTRYMEQRSDTLVDLTDQMLCQIADLPDGRNYMSLKGHRSPMHEDYTDVEDRSNANFLWFVKFERNFQQKEQDMMEDSLMLSAEVIDFSKRAHELRGNR
ncbi:MAG: DUF6782 family putative metallopeptidase [Pseudomonadota bacterium]